MGSELSLQNMNHLVAMNKFPDIAQTQLKAKSQQPTAKSQKPKTNSPCASIQQ
jgi:hypothetical protein